MLKKELVNLSMGLGTVTVDGDCLGIASIEIKDLSKDALGELLEVDQLKASSRVKMISDFRDSFKLVCSFRNKPVLHSLYNKAEVRFKHFDTNYYVLLNFPKTKAELFDLDGYAFVVFETHPNEDNSYGSIETGEHIC